MIPISDDWWTVPRRDAGAWISGPQEEFCGDRKPAGRGGDWGPTCCLDPHHAERGEPHESADYEWDDSMEFARLKTTEGI